MSESEDGRRPAGDETDGHTLTGDVVHLDDWAGGGGEGTSSGTGELQGKLNADWLVSLRMGGAEGGANVMDIFLTGVRGGV